MQSAKLPQPDNVLATDLQDLGNSKESYRWNFLKRATHQTANDYSNVFQLTDTANVLIGGDYTTNMDAIVDTEEWMRIFAVEHATGNWDSVGYQNSQNMYGYKPQRGKWTLFIWDYNIVLGNSGSHGPDGNNLFNISLNGQDLGAMSRFYSNPKFRRAYLRTFKELADGPTWAIRWSKLAVNKWLKEQANLIMDTGLAYEMMTFKTKDHEEAVKAFVEKRKPNYLRNG